MGLTLNITADDERIRELLIRLSRRMRDTTPVMREIGEIVLESIQRNFRQGRSPEGKRWKPSRRAIREGGKTLMDNRILFGSLNDACVLAGRDRVRIGTNVPYAAVHQLGARRGSFGEVLARVRSHSRRSRGGGTHIVRAHVRRQKLPWGDIPARPFMGVRREDWGEIHDTVMDYLLLGGR